MEESDDVRIVVTVPESHAEVVREAMGKAGAGRVGNYSFCSFSQKGVGRFMPVEGSDPFIGECGILEAVEEERIETVCPYSILEKVVEEIKKVHPYEEMVIDIYPVYEIGRKRGKRRDEDE